MSVRRCEPVKNVYLQCLPPPLQLLQLIITIIIKYDNNLFLLYFFNNSESVELTTDTQIKWVNQTEDNEIRMK